MPHKIRKRTLPHPQKSQLLFLEQPRNGARHGYGQKFQSATNPKSFISKEPRQNIAVSSWVSPQFTSLEETAVRQGGRRKKKNQLPASTVNATSILSLPQIRTTCKYPALSFETSGPLPQRYHNMICNKTVSSCAEKTQGVQNLRPSRCNGGTLVTPNSCSEVPIETPISFITIRRHKTTQSGATVTPFRPSEIVKTHHGCTVGKPRTLTFVHTPDTSTDFTPPHIETPEMSHSDHSHSSSIHHLLFSPDQLNSPPKTQSLGLLMKDTPKRDYGLKVTWRRRKNLMKLLTKRGQLLVNETMISNK